jgi:uncharacterized protein YjbJ (UPF0337 family)
VNKDRIEGKVKDVAGSIERKAGELTDNPKLQVKGAAKQVEGKVQNAVGQVKDAVKKAQDDAASPKPPQRVPDVADDEDFEETPEETRRSRG